LAFVQQHFFLSAKFQFGFIESQKSRQGFLALVLVNKGFDWLCFVALVFVRGRFCRLSKLACLFVAKVLAS
jgi:hypothetical protein